MELSQYTEGRVPLEVFAHRVGMDTLDVSAGLVGRGFAEFVNREGTANFDKIISR